MFQKPLYFVYCDTWCLPVLDQQMNMLPSVIDRHQANTSFWTTLNININATCKVLVSCFISLNKNSQKCSRHTKSVFISNIVHKCVYIPVSEHFSFAKIIHPPDRSGISRNWLNSMIITQVHLVLGTIKGHSKMCSFITQHNATRCAKFWGSVQLPFWLKESPPELLPDNLMLISLPFAASNMVLENLAVRPTGLTTTDHV